MTWKDRVNPNIRFTSPNGNIFIAFWQSNTRKITKKLGIFEIPDYNGTQVQDLGATSERVPISFFFSGINNDLEATRFFKAIQEKGEWNIYHPILGKRQAFLVSVEENLDPVRSGNITTLNSEWIFLPVKPFKFETIPKLIEKLLAQITNTNLSASNQLVDNTKQDTPIQRFSIKDAAGKLITSTIKIVTELVDQDSETNKRFNSIQRSITNTLNEDIINLENLSSEIQYLVQTPLRASLDISSRLNTYNDLIDEIFTISPIQVLKESLNIVNVQEIFAVSALTALSEIVITGDLTTRKATIGFIDSSTDIFNNTIEKLDTNQKLFDDLNIDKQYFSQSQSFADSALLMASTTDYLLRSLFDLKIEKKIITKRLIMPIDLTVQEYGSLGENDANLDFLISSNQLKDIDILYLQPGREILIYI